MSEKPKAKRLSTDRVRGGARRPDVEAPPPVRDVEADARPRAASSETSARTVTG